MLPGSESLKITLFIFCSAQSCEAVKFDSLGYGEVITRDLKVADMTAITLCRDNKLPILVFELLAEGNIARAVKGEKIGTLVGDHSRD